MENKTKDKRKTLVFVMSTLYAGELVKECLKYRILLEEKCIDQGHKLPQYRVAFAWEPLDSIKPGKQDLVLAGGRQEDEGLVQKLKGTGQLVARYSQLFKRTPYCGRSIEEMGYALDLDKLAPYLPSHLMMNENFLMGVAEHNADKIARGLEFMAGYPTGYLKECCEISVNSTPKKRIQEVLGKEPKHMDVTLDNLTKGVSVAEGEKILLAYIKEANKKN